MIASQRQGARNGIKNTGGWPASGAPHGGTNCAEKTVDDELGGGRGK